MRKGRILVFWMASLLLFVPFMGITAQFTAVQHGIKMKIGGQWVELAVAKTGAFRLSVNSKENQASIPSIFLDPEDSACSSFTVVSKTPFYGIKTAYGKLLVNVKEKTWSLYDDGGKALIKDGRFLATDTAQVLRSPKAGTELFYGSGNLSTKSLIKTGSKSVQGNGTTDLPCLWSTKGYGMLGVTTDDNNPAKWSSDNGVVKWTFSGTSSDLYLWPAKTLYDNVHILVQLTGKPKLPPHWAFGYLQSQWGWQDRAYIEDALTKFRTHKLPVDAFIFDFEWYTTTPDYTVKKEGQEDFTDFTFNPKLFPEPAKQIADYHNEGIKFIGIRKPRLGNAASLCYMRSKGWLAKPESDSRDLNFRNDSLRHWYVVQNKPLLDAGIDAWWDDEGESYYSCYYWWNKAQIELRSQVRPNNRHFSINRSFSLGNQRLGYCTWNGDIYSTWKYLQETPSDLLNFGLAGMCYGSCDIGGFHGTPAKEVLVRWFEAGVFFPVMRAHSDLMTTPHFPWLWDADGEAAIRKALNLRYQLVPFIYSLGHEAYRTGAPVMRPLVMEFPNDTAVANLTDEWLLGKELLAAPVLNEGGKRSVYLPADLWYEFGTGKAIKGPVKFAVTKGLDEIPVYVRAGSILPVGPVVQYTAQDTAAPLEIRIYPGHNGTFTLTEDDGISYDYTSGKVLTTTFTWNDAARKLTWKVNGTLAYPHIFRSAKVVLADSVLSADIEKDGSLVFKNR
ncbi:MAG TPA: TIM-barrel domain-containing protein [Bacteroidales bacterium]